MDLTVVQYPQRSGRMFTDVFRAPQDVALIRLFLGHARNSREPLMVE